MAKTIKVTCTADHTHVNEIELEKILKPVIVARSAAPSRPREIPQRSVFKCEYCQTGKVVVTREMVQDALA